MGFGVDFADILSEVGTAITIVRGSGNITGEYLLYDSNAQVTKPFIREFFLEATASYETDIVAGDVVMFNDTSSKYLVMNKSPDRFENEVYRYSLVLYLCNVTVDIKRPVESDGTDDDYYRTRTTWTTIASSQPACLTSAQFGAALSEEEEIGPLVISPQDLYVPSSIGIKELDRVVVSLSEWYEVRNVYARRFPSVDQVALRDDNRSGTTTTTTTTTTTSSTTTTTV